MEEIKKLIAFQSSPVALELKTKQQQIQEDFKKEDLLGKYKCDIKLHQTFGPYEWCGTINEQQTKGTYILTQSGAQNNNAKMIHLVLTPNSNLQTQCDYFKILDEFGRMVWYQYDVGNDLVYTTKFIETTPSKFYTIEFFKIFIMPPDWPGYRMVSQSPLLLIKSLQIMVPPISIKSDQSVCAICLETFKFNYYSEEAHETKEVDLFVGNCEHQFHSSCIWKYIFHNADKFLLPTDCRDCKHSQKSTPFPCPVCKQIIQH